MLMKRRFGHTDMHVSPLGLGTVKLGRDKGVKYPSRFTIPDDREALSLIAQAKDLGINLIDTAPAYGNSEERLGKLLKGQRNDWLICSKVGEEFDNHSGDSSFNFSPEHTRFSIERSLARLNTDVIDMVLVHSDGNDVDIINRYGILDVLKDIKQQGLIRTFGMSTKTVAGGLLAAKQSDCAMVTHNLAYRDEEPVIDYCQQHGKAVLLKKALASGHIVTDDSSSNNKTDPIQSSMDFIFANPGVTSAIVGTINPKHLLDNVEKAYLALTKRNN